MQYTSSLKQTKAGYCLEDVQIADIIAQVQTPFYLYSTAHFARVYKELELELADLNALICYAVKANSNQSILASFATMGAGADIVSGGELERALQAGFAANKIVFAGVGKSSKEIAQALRAGILQFNVESDSELTQIDQLSKQLQLPARIAIRVNPDVDAQTHKKITTGKDDNKFGVDFPTAMRMAQQIAQMPYVKLEALSVHIGSQLTSSAPYGEAFERLAQFVKQLKAAGVTLQRLDLGGGLGIAYSEQAQPEAQFVAQYAALIRKHIKPLGLALIIEPGRFLIGNAGLLIAKVLSVKTTHSGRNFLIIDAAMNDLIRPALYDAYHHIFPLSRQQPDNSARALYDVVGPVCESGDTFAVQRELPVMQAGDIVAFASAGAYGAVMSSTYNSRPLIPEVLVKGADWHAVRPRQTIAQLIAQDSMPPWLTNTAVL